MGVVCVGVVVVGGVSVVVGGGVGVISGGYIDIGVVGFVVDVDDGVGVVCVDAVVVVDFGVWLVVVVLFTNRDAVLESVGKKNQESVQ